MPLSALLPIVEGTIVPLSLLLNLLGWLGLGDEGELRDREGIRGSDHGRLKGRGSDASDVQIAWAILLLP